MAPRIPETFKEFEARLKRALQAGHTEIRYGLHHASHALCVEDGVFRVRRLEVSAEEAEAYLREHGIFMPEHSEAISKARTIELEEATLKELVSKLEESWPG